MESHRLFNQGHYREVLDLLSDSGPLSHPKIAYYQALAWARLGQINDALMAINIVIERESHFVTVIHARMVKSFLLTSLQLFVEAEKDLRQMIDEGIESSQVFSHYGYILWAMNRTKEAISWLNQAIKLDLNNSTALNSLAYFLAEEKILLNKALRLCLKALSIKKEHPSYLDTLGWIYYKMGELQLSKWHLEKALLAQPENHVFQSHLSEVQKKISLRR